MNDRSTRLFRGRESLVIYSGDFFLCVEKNWYYWSVEKWISFNWEHIKGPYYISTDLRPSSPLEFLVVTGRPLENELV